MPMKVAALLLTVCLVAGCRADEADLREKRLFAYFSTTSSTTVTTVTITDISTCLSTKTGNCNGRRKKRLALNYIEDLEQMNDIPLDSTRQVENIEVRQVRAADDAGEREGKVLTIWTTHFSTLTVTTTSVLASTTVTASALCLAPNVAKTCFGG
ncbi:uncharacterized protein LOC125039850 [Penaeus chinensis]|uniref:uncharacterized protein LOC125039850 n=1 Tax=Penaeus chinensis TaxID=139456 RepID=UPI001FB82665|nr:uncharacterized protein LOC125039850 [Penaeus chinensis]